jgi:hypothetical protein
MKIEVTREDIDNGLPGEPRDCPVAFAIRRATKNRLVFVSNYKAHIGDGIAYLPDAATEFIQSFDLDEPVEPFAFELDV